MPAESHDAQQQLCPACGALVDVTGVELLARVLCPACGEKFRVESAFDHFVLVETLGLGGMGSVYKARDTRLDRFVALKILHKDADAAYTQELEHEARVTASVNHPHVVKVFSTGSAHDQFYLVMELVDQGSLDDLIEEAKHVPEAQVLAAAIQVARGLEAAHEIGLMHRDVKPANILFADTETAKIVDFGLAGVADPRATAAGAIWGTPYYVAPERLKNEPEDFRSDIFSLGATLFHALAGRPPIEGETNSAAKLRELKSRPPNLRAFAPNVSRATTRIINRMLQPEPAARFQSYQELIGALEDAAGTGERAAIRKRRRWQILAGAAFLGLIAIAILFATGKLDSLGRNPTDAQAIAAPDPVFLQRYDAARRQLAEGKFEAASRSFSALAKQTSRQPLLDWIRMHKGLAALLGGHSRPAQESFLTIVKEGPFSATPADVPLAKFLVATAKTLASEKTISSGEVAAANHDSAEAFAILLFAIKDFAASDFMNASRLLEQFVAAQPPPQYAWINDYKPLAQKYLDDLRLYLAWKEQTKVSTSPPERTAALTNLLGIERRLQTQGRLADQIKSEAVVLSTQSSGNISAQTPAPDQTSESNLAREKPAWTATLGQFRKEVFAYDFAAASATMARPQFTNPLLQQEQQNMKKKAQWLIDWQTRLIEDLNHSHFTGVVADRVGTQFNGVASASAREIVLKNPSGMASVPWSRLPPQTLLAISDSFIKPGAPDTTDRQWLCAIFASETDQPEAAHQLARAASSKPEYRELLPVISR